MTKQLETVTTEIGTVQKASSVPLRKSLKTDLARVEESLKPASPKDATAIVGRLLVHFWQPGRPEEHWKLIAEDYVDALEAFPADILDAGRKESLRRYKFMPKIAELLEILGPMLEERRRERAWLRDRLSPPKPQREFERMTDKDKRDVSAAIGEMKKNLAAQFKAPMSKRISIPKLTKAEIAEAEAQLDRDRERVAREMKDAGMVETTEP